MQSISSVSPLLKETLDDVKNSMIRVSLGWDKPVMLYPCSHNCDEDTANVLFGPMFKRTEEVSKFTYEVRPFAGDPKAKCPEEVIAKVRSDDLYAEISYKLVKKIRHIK